VTRTTNVTLALVGGMALLVLAGYCALVRLDGPGIAGTAIGTGLGLLNLLIGIYVARRALRHGMQSAMRTLLGGFFGRMVVLAALILVFQRTSGVNEVAFALSFMVLFFVFLGVELYLVERSLQRRSS
jgi:hypothetical protein